MAFASNYQHPALEYALERAAHRRYTRRRCESYAAAAPTPGRNGAAHSGIRDCTICEHAATFSIAGYQILGSPVTRPLDFATSVSEVADTLTWVRGRHTLKTGFGWRLGTAQRDPAAIADRIVQFNQLGRIFRKADHGRAARQPTRTGPIVLDRSADVADRSAPATRVLQFKTTGR